MIGTYLHIGGPKCASKSLQQGFFHAHPQLHHLGMGSADGMVTWPDSDVQRVIEVDVRLKRDFAYDAAPVKAVIDRHSQLAERAGGEVRLMGVSYENLSCTMAYDVDLTTKAHRLFDAFGPGTKIVYVFRNQLSLLRSTYAESLCAGLKKSFVEYVDYLIDTQFQSTLIDMKFGSVIELYADLFGADNIIATPLEEILPNSAAYADGLAEFLGVTPLGAPLPKLNPALGPQQLAVMRRLNDKLNHDFGGTHADLLFAFRQANYFNEELGRGLPLDAVIDQQLISISYSLASQIGSAAEIAPLPMEPRDDQRRFLDGYFRADNQRLAGLTGLDLKAMNYPGMTS
jgi:hypothetical protein